MTVKEKDAYKHDCPMKLSSGAGALNSMCSGKGCMAWRWEHTRNPDYKAKHPFDFVDTTESPWIVSKTHGYCGMAGHL